MIDDHKFQPAPFYPDRCDAFDKGSSPPRRCTRPGCEHTSCNGSEGHVSEFMVVPNVTRTTYARCKECFLFLGVQAPGESLHPPKLIAREAAVTDTKRVILMRHEAISAKIQEALEILALKKGIAAVVPRVRKLLTEMLALCGESG